MRRTFKGIAAASAVVGTMTVPTSVWAASTHYNTTKVAHESITKLHSLLVNQKESFTVTIKDAHNKAISGALVYFHSYDRSVATASAGHVVTNKSGQAKVTISGHKAGSTWLKVTVNGLSHWYKVTVTAPAAPTVSISGLSNGQVVTLASQKVTVNSNEKSVKLYLNGKPQSGSKLQNGRFAFSLKLRDGKNTITAVATNGLQTKKQSIDVTYSFFSNVDLRYPAPASVTASQMDKWIAANHKGDMEGLGSYFVNAQNQYGANATYLLAHAALETGWGTSDLALKKNNWFGYGAYGDDAYGYGGMFPSSEYAIMFEAWEVRQNYLTPGATHDGGSPTLTGMSKANYASDPEWATSIGEIMNEYVSQTGGSKSDYVQYQSSNKAPAPLSSTEPVYKVGTDAMAEVAPTSPYSSLPVFPSLSADAEDDFLYGTLSQTTSATSFPAVKQLQQALNQDPYVYPKLTVDGLFGPQTAQAVEQYQQAHGLSVTGVCDDATWAQLFPATGTSLHKGQVYHIDEMAEFLTTGMSGGNKEFATLWYHIVNLGWVPSTEVQLDNVYQVIPSTGYSVKLTGTSGSVTLHRGDFAVQNSKGQLEVYNQQTGKLIVGLPSAPVNLEKFTMPEVHGS
ncbi:glucosaminidase domain-containing protein [Alicyclobacillus shizuokensis]|uniref:glucosaminidase domain-containing protein n=1 Tax=Alicyclobacillus shizuokensis TaxID=392014 RepID=UPI00082C529A|nr:glucosaminidase domain-containing protein [Alicyclobacillus shizuokensis]